MPRLMQRKSWSGRTSVSSQENNSSTATVIDPAARKPLLPTDSKIQQFESAEERDLWIEFTETRNQKLIPRLVEIYSTFVEIEVLHQVKKLPYAPIVTVDDLRNEAFFAILQCIQRFRIEKNVNFKVWSRFRLRGAMKDCLRKLQHFPRSIAAARRTVPVMRKNLNNKLGRRANEEEFIEHYGTEWSKTLYDPLLNTNVFNQMTPTAINSDGNSIESIEDYRGTPENNSDYRFELIRIVDAELMDQDTKDIMFGYYFFNMTVGQIASALKMSTSNVVIKRLAAIKRLKWKLDLTRFKENLR